MLAEAFTQDGAQPFKGENLRPGLPESISRRLCLVQTGLAPLFKLRGICDEAGGPVVMPINGNNANLMHYFVLTA